MELCSVLCGRLDGRGVWGRMDTYTCMSESFCCPPETTTTLFIGVLQYKIHSLITKCMCLNSLLITPTETTSPSAEYFQSHIHLLSL